MLSSFCLTYCVIISLWKAPYVAAMATVVIEPGDFDPTKTLEYNLCNSSVDLNNTVIKLKPGNYTIVGRGICIVENVHNFLLTSPEKTTINCWKSVGFMFLKSFNISISNITFKKCGGPVVGRDVLSRHQSMKLDSKEIALMYINCLNISLHNVSVLEYTGFGILTINVENFIKLDSVIVSKLTNVQCKGVQR